MRRISSSMARRRAPVVVLTAVLGAVVAAATALAERRASFGVGITPNHVHIDAFLEGNVTEGPYVLDVVRAGTVVATKSGSSAQQIVDLEGELAAGDVLRISSKAADAVVTYDGTPTIDDGACIGSRAIRGAA